MQSMQVNFIKIIQKAFFFQVSERLNIIGKHAYIYTSLCRRLTLTSDLTLEGRPYSATPFSKKDNPVDALFCLNWQGKVLIGYIHQCKHG